MEAGFGAVADAFAANFAEHGEVGAACCVYVDGRRVVDLWGGVAFPDREAEWEADTPVIVFSSTKGATALCVHRLVQRGALDLDAPIASYWPEFAAEGKGEVPLRWALSHRVGVPAVDAPVTLDDVVGWDGVVAAVAAQRPEWRPGTAHGYHARTFGWMLGEVVRRVTGRSLGRFFAEEVAGPLGLDWWIGLPASVEPATMLGPHPPADPALRELMEEMMGPGTLLGRVMSGPSDLFAYDDRWNTRPYLAAEMPSSNGVASARAIARMYAATIGAVDGVRLLDPATVQLARTVQSDDTDRVLGVPTRFGLGFALTPLLGASCPPGAFGHPGAGGSLGFADPERGVAFGYAMNQMKLGVSGDERSDGLVRAVYDSL